MKRLLAGLVIVAASLAAHAQDAAAPAADPTAAARAAFAAMRSAQSAASAEKDQAKKDKLDKKSDDAYEKFGAEFDKLDWNAWDRALDTEILAIGVNRNATKAFEAEDFPRARKGWEFLADEMPSERTAAYAVARHLPYLYAAIGEFDDGCKRLRAYAAHLSPADAGLILMGLGDLCAAKSDFDAAKKAYADARAVLAKAAGSRDKPVAGFVATRLDSRAQVGESVRDLLGSDSASSKPFRLSGASGKPAVCYAFSLLGILDRDRVRTLSALQKKYGRSGLTVVGITTFDLLTPLTMVDNEVEATMPRNADDEAGEKVKVTREGFRKYVETYRQRTKATFPFLIAADEALKDYAEFARSTALVLDEHQKIVLAAGIFDRDALRWIAQAVCIHSAAAHPPAPATGK